MPRGGNRIIGRHEGILRLEISKHMSVLTVLYEKYLSRAMLRNYGVPTKLAEEIAKGNPKHKHNLYYKEHDLPEELRTYLLTIKPAVLEAKARDKENMVYI